MYNRSLSVSGDLKATARNSASTKSTSETICGDDTAATVSNQEISATDTADNEDVKPIVKERTAIISADKDEDSDASSNNDDNSVKSEMVKMILLSIKSGSHL